MTHHLKTLHEYFQAVIDGRKPFELRENDRGFKVGDIVVLKEYLGKEEVPECSGWENCPVEVDIHGKVDCSLLNDGTRVACLSYTKELYSGRRCVLEIKEIFKLDKIGFENYVAFTFDILNVQEPKAGGQ